jgi:hypothetical protein
MPRPILGTPQAEKVSITLPPQTTSSRSTLHGVRLHARLREKRSTKYLQAMTRLDAGTQHVDRTALESLLEAIANEFPELGIEQLPVGIVSQCYLGAPYEVHICDLSGGIIEHFETFRPMPPLYERARALATHPSYSFIEIYADTLRVISLDGSVSVIER